MKNLQKIPLFFSLLIIKLLTIVFFIVFFYNVSLTDLINSKNIHLNITTLYLVLFYFSILSSLYFSDKKTFSSVFQQKNNSINFILSWILGFIIISLFFIFELIVNFISLNSLEVISVTYVIKTFILSFLVGFIEELLFRNFIFNNLKKDLKLKTSYVLSAYIYAQLHFLNFSLRIKEIIIPLLGLFILGLLFNTLYEKKGLFFSIGFHASFIFVMSVITQKNLFKIDSDYLLLSGGYNPLAGVFGIVFLSMIFITTQVFNQNRFLTKHDFFVIK